MFEALVTIRINFAETRVQQGTEGVNTEILDSLQYSISKLKLDHWLRFLCTCRITNLVVFRFRHI